MKLWPENKTNLLALLNVLVTLAVALSVAIIALYYLNQVTASILYVAYFTLAAMTILFASIIGFRIAFDSADEENESEPHSITALQAALRKANLNIANLIINAMDTGERVHPTAFVAFREGIELDRKLAEQFPTEELSPTIAIQQAGKLVEADSSEAPGQDLVGTITDIREFLVRCDSEQLTDTHDGLN